MKDFFVASRVDAKAFEKAAKNTTELGEKLTDVAFIVAEKSTKISNNLAKQTLIKLRYLSKAASVSANYKMSLIDFASAQAEVASENFVSVVEVAKKVQMEKAEVMMIAGYDVSADASVTMKTATFAVKSTPTVKSTVKAAE